MLDGFGPVLAGAFALAGGAATGWLALSGVALTGAGATGGFGLADDFGASWPRGPQIGMWVRMSCAMAPPGRPARR
jgi:hypothetical protein